MKLKILLLAILMTGVSFTGLCQLNEGLVAWYPFNGNAKDASGNGNDATLVNSPSYVTGAEGLAVYLTGQGNTGTEGQYVLLPNLALTNYRTFTIALWAKIDGLTDPQGGEALISLGAYTFQGNAIGIFYVSNPPQIAFTAGSRTGVSAPPPSQVTNWAHYALVYDNGRLTGFINGKSVATKAGIRSGQSGNTAGIGIHWFPQSPGGVSTRFIGAIDDVRIYNRALSLQEIQALSATPPQVTTGSASSITAHSAMLNGSVNPNGLATKAFFYGDRIPLSPVTVGSDTTPHIVSGQTLSGLKPNTTYHFRLVAYNGAGTAYGTDQTFTTLSDGN